MGNMSATWSCRASRRYTDFGGTRDDEDCYYLVTGFARPATIYHYELESGKSTVYKEPEVDFEPEEFVTKQVFYKSKDGTRIPMFICHKKGLELDGRRPVYLTGYGGFDISLTPGFSLSNAVWMEMGGVFAQPNLRGGGEYGEAWHEAGRKGMKQNVFDDFIAAGEWLIENKYTNHERLAIGGGQQWRVARRCLPSRSARSSLVRRCRRWACSTCCASTNSPSAGHGRVSMGARTRPRNSNRSMPTRRTTV